MKIGQRVRVPTCGASHVVALPATGTVIECSRFNVGYWRVKLDYPGSFIQPDGSVEPMYSVIEPEENLIELIDDWTTREVPKPNAQPVELLTSVEEAWLSLHRGEAHWYARGLDLYWYPHDGSFWKLTGQTRLSVAVQAAVRGEGVKGR